MECCALRIKDLQIPRGQIVLRCGKGNKDRDVMLRRSVRADLERQLARRRQLHERDLARGVARVDLPRALERTCSRADQEVGWQFVLASRQLSRCPRTGRLGRHHVYPASRPTSSSAASTCERILVIPAHFNHALSFDVQGRELLVNVPLTPEQWQTTPMIINSRTAARVLLISAGGTVS